MTQLKCEVRALTWHYKHKQWFWFRVFGYGLNFINRDIHPPLFSVRNGYTKEIRVGKCGIRLLKRG